MANNKPTPHLANCCRSLHRLHEHLFKHSDDVKTWFDQQWQLTPAPITSSIDIRNAGYKIAPVDTNLFPAGYNNLDPHLLPTAVKAVQDIFSHQYPNCERLLLIPESHTQHPYYYQSLAILQKIFIKAGYEVRIGSMIENLQTPTPVKINEDTEIILEPIRRENNRIKLSDYDPCLLILNNDLSGGIPEILKNIEQKIIPPPEIGWSQRMKSTHFKHFAEISTEFAKMIDVDPWVIQPLFRTCTSVDFVNRENEECLIDNTHELLKAIQKKYDEYEIKHQPFVVIKADQGTYGLGIFMVKDANEISQLNRKQRQKMSTIKGKQKLDRVILQEGIYTFETVGEEKSVAEPVAYLIGQHIIGGFYRVHTERRHDENLNAPGMHFEPLAFTEHCISSTIKQPPDEESNKFYAYCVIARLATLAAARELKEISQESLARGINDD